MTCYAGYSPPKPLPDGTLIIISMKTNKQWCPFTEYGSHYKLDGDELYQCPMNHDGARADSPACVDFGNCVEPHNVATLKIIIHELSLKD